MNELTDKCGKKTIIALAASVGLNIFLAAFALGHTFTLHPHPGDVGPMPPPSFAMNKPAGGPGMPFFGPQALFTADEMRAQEEKMRDNFEKVAGLRKTFAEKLSAGAVTREEALAHFAAIDQIMDPVRKEAQGKAADKISQLSDEDRRTFAQNLARHESRMMNGPGGFGGRGMGGQGQGMGGQGRVVGPGMGFGGPGRGGPAMNAPASAPDTATPPAPPQEDPAAAQPAR